MFGTDKTAPLAICGWVRINMAIRLLMAEGKSEQEAFDLVIQRIRTAFPFDRALYTDKFKDALTVAQSMLDTEGRALP